ncbi:MAG: 50S ribosomal protein L25 [Terrimicrobiaceae bacterium]|nr:50S ribosomal protein L25 [Terrimicrobiaceae bacterium]
MANQVKLAARPRSESGRNAVKQVRARGGVPAVIYGTGVEPANLEVSRREIEGLLAHAVGENILVELEIDENGKKTNRLSLIQEVQHHPLRGEVLHVDFHAVSATEEIEAEIVVETVGEADGVKNFGGLLEQALRSVTIKCLPQNLPQVLHVDVTALKVGDSIHVRDLVLPTGVTVTDDPDLTVVTVAEPNVAEVEASTPAAAGPEVLKEKKPEAGAADDKK